MPHNKVLKGQSLEITHTFIIHHAYILLLSMMNEFVSNYLLLILVVYHVNHVSNSVVKGVELGAYPVAPG